MKIVLAPNAFKGSLRAAEAAEAMRRGIERVDPGIETIAVPVADGGDGLAEVLADAMGGKIRTATVDGPLGRPTQARYCYVAKRATAVIEMAEVSGLALVAEGERDAMRATTAGTGQLIAEAVRVGARHLIVGIGGSATNDGGAGMADALGIRFLDRRGRSIAGPGGGDLCRIERIDSSGLSPALEGVEIEVVCDVGNPLLGPEGASRVYGPQKGASPEQVEALEAGLAHLADLMKRDLGVDVLGLRGGGAAGGLGARLCAFLGARLRPGTDLVLEFVGLVEKMEGADLVITGEGRIDEQTPFGKAPAGVAALARRHGIPCIALAGSVSGDCACLHDSGITAVFSTCRGPISLADAIAEASNLLDQATEQAVRAFLAGRTLKAL